MLTNPIATSSLSGWESKYCTPYRALRLHRERSHAPTHTGVLWTENRRASELELPRISVAVTRLREAQ
jgi:hypothetical protein